MQRLCFKKRKDSRTVQIVRHAYCRQRKRSRTIAIGSFPASADPEDFLPDLRLNVGMVITEDERCAIARWLLENGDPEWARRRRSAAERLEKQLREALQAENALASDIFDVVEKALDDAAHELSEIAGDLHERGEDVWKALRPRYLRLLGAWDRFQHAAQTAGITKKKRGGDAVGSPVHSPLDAAADGGFSESRPEGVTQVPQAPQRGRVTLGPAGAAEGE